jgi:hypothetical protein
MRREWLLKRPRDPQENLKLERRRGVAEPSLRARSVARGSGDRAVSGTGLLESTQRRNCPDMSHRGAREGMDEAQEGQRRAVRFARVVGILRNLGGKGAHGKNVCASETRARPTGLPTVLSFLDMSRK